MCEKHQSLLVHQAGYSEKDSWRVLIVAAQIALFQAASCDIRIQEGKEIAKIESVGCLACFKPDAFGELVEVAKAKDIGKIKALGESWLQKSSEEKVNS